ncbi:hypothetical protein [uncultured Clostridium sp.]|uniref:hypothetical protein n=1 Tax=uncultured Clostridium sp. TaxID=59620 RepID=UPI0028E44C3B|nr:hypothetical protein [uncultured Clostridium sp.]
MKKYTNGKREIYATDKAYEVIYKEQGFKERDKVEKEVVENVKPTESKNTITNRGRKSK